MNSTAGPFIDAMIWVSSASGVARSRGYADGMRDGRKLNIRRGVSDKTRKRGGLLDGPGNGRRAD